MQDSYLIDKARVRASFDRAAHSYDGAAILQTTVCKEMLSRLDLVSMTPHTILDLGCGTGHASVALKQRFKAAQVISLDLAFSMLQKTQANQPWLQKLFGQKSLVCADIESLPFADASVDLIWSNLAIQWCNDLDQTFAEMQRVLKPDGLLMFSTFGPDTLKELRAASQNGHTHVSRFIDMHDIGDALSRMGFQAPVLDVEHFTLTYDDVQSVMRDLKVIGAHNATAGRPKGLMGKGFLQQLAQQYEPFRQAEKAAGGQLPATYEVVYGHAWKPKAKPAQLDGVSPIHFKPRA